MNYGSRKSNLKFILAFFTLYFLFSTVTCGCASFRKKFVRKPRKKREVEVVIETQEYESIYSIGERYKRYFLFWRTAQAELIRDMDARKVNRKKRVIFAQRIVDNLQQMRRWLLPEKQEQLDVYISEQEDLVRQLDVHSLSRHQTLTIKSTLRKHKKDIQRQFAFKQIQEYLVKE